MNREMQMTIEDYIFCEDCQEYVDFFQYDHNIKDTGHAEHKWRNVTEEELKGCVADCMQDGCFE